MVGCFCGEVSVSGLRLELASLDRAADWFSCLTSDETQRLEGITHPVLRERFTVSRGLRRKVLAEALHCDYGDLSIVEDAGTKPRLLGGQGWDFNVSHAGDYVAVVVGRGEVGVDLEKVRPVREMAALVARYFHRDEAAAWQALSAEQKSAAFFSSGRLARRR
jgi:4'-phosphopantetheinyl transferase